MSAILHISQPKIISPKNNLSFCQHYSHHKMPSRNLSPILGAILFPPITHCAPKNNNCYPREEPKNNKKKSQRVGEIGICFPSGKANYLWKRQMIGMVTVIQPEADLFKNWKGKYKQILLSLPRAPPSLPSFCALKWMGEWGDWPLREWILAKQMMRIKRRGIYSILKICIFAHWFPT